MVMYSNDFVIKELILYNPEYLDYICITKNAFIYSHIISLLIENIKSPLFIVLIRFSQYK